MVAGILEIVSTVLFLAHLVVSCCISIQGTSGVGIQHESIYGVHHDRESVAWHPPCFHNVYAHASGFESDIWMVNWWVKR